MELKRALLCVFALVVVAATNATPMTAKRDVDVIRIARLSVVTTPKDRETVSTLIAIGALRTALVRAIVAKDWRTVATLTNWPLAVDAYEAPPKMTKADFLKKPATLYSYFGAGDKDLLKCIATGIPVRHYDATFGAGDWLVDCNGNEFYFGLRGGKALFTAYQNINE